MVNINISLIETQYDCLFPLTGNQNGIDQQ